VKDAGAAGGHQRPKHIRRWRLAVFGRRCAEARNIGIKAIAQARGVVKLMGKRNVSEIAPK